MALVTSAVVGAGTVAYGAKKQGDAGKDAARAHGEAADATIAEQRRQFDLIQKNNAPFQHVGTGAINQLARISGLSPYTPPREQPKPMTRDQWSAQNALTPTGGGIKGLIGGASAQESGYQNYLNEFNSTQPALPVAQEQAGAPDYSEFFKSPDYQFALDQGTQAAERSAAARGMLGSGNTLVDLTRYGQGLATQNFGNYVNRLSSLAGSGQVANNSNANAGLATGANVGNALIGAGGARASGIIDSANAWGDAAGGIAGIAGNTMREWDRRRNRQSTGPAVWV